MTAYRNDSPLDRRVFAFLIAAACLLRVAIAWRPFQWQLSHTLSDDAFYYFTIARRLARFGLPSFDGISPTNGFHPLWLSLITPAYVFPISDTTAVHIILTFCALLDTFSLVLLIRILRGLHAGVGATAVTAALFAFSPALLSHAGPLNGMETSLAVFLLFSLLFSYCAVVRNTREWYATPGAFGALMGLVVLARTDTFVIAGTLGLALGFSRTPDRMRFALRTAVAAMIVLSPWLFWNLMTFGTIFQVSGEAYTLSAGALYHTESWNVLDYALRFLDNCADVLRFFPVKLESATKLSIPFGIQAVLVGGIALALAGTVIRYRSQSRRALRSRLHLLVPPLAGVVLFVLVHSLRTITLRGWYYAIVLPVLYVLMGVVGDTIVRGMRGWMRGGVVVTCGVVLPFLLITSAVRHWRHDDGERAKYAALAMINDATPPGARIGSWNAGVYGYFLKNRTVVNLDGLVNNAVYPHLVQHSVGRYCRWMGIAYIVDMGGTFTLWDPFWGGPPGSLARSVRTLRTAGPGESDTTVRIATTQVSPFSRE